MHTTNVTMKTKGKYDVSYKTKDDAERVMIKPCNRCLENDKFVTDCDCPKSNYKYSEYSNKLLIPTIFDLYFGFYCDTRIEFDMYIIYHTDTYHYVLEPGKFTPIYTRRVIILC